MFEDHDDYWDDDEDLDAFNEPRPAIEFPLVKESDPELERLLAEPLSVEDARVKGQLLVTCAMGHYLPWPRDLRPLPRCTCYTIEGYKCNLPMMTLPVVIMDIDRMPKLPDPQLEALLREEELIDLQAHLNKSYGEGYDQAIEDKKPDLQSFWQAGYSASCGDNDYRLASFVEWLFGEGRVHTLSDSALFAIVKKVTEVSQ